DVREGTLSLNRRSIVPSSEKSDQGAKIQEHQHKMSKVDDKRIAELVEPIQNDLLSGAAELALRAISIFQMVLSESEADSEDELRAVLKATAISLVDCQPAMAPIFHLSNSV